jgi:hypothetical protein
MAWAGVLDQVVFGSRAFECVAGAGAAGDTLPGFILTRPWVLVACRGTGTRCPLGSAQLVVGRYNEEPRSNPPDTVEPAQEGSPIS